jgi:hypothetical protein
VIAIEPIHAPSVEKDYRDKEIDRALLCEPKSELHPEEPDAIQAIREDDRAAE